MTNDHLEVTISRTIEAPRPADFEAWLDPKMLAEFLRPASEMPAPSVSTDATEGGWGNILETLGQSLKAAA